MPDLVTHCSMAYFAKELSGRPRATILFFVGTLLPDILTRPFYILHPGLTWIVTPFHTPVILGLLSLLISYLFRENNRKAVFLALLSGGYFHIFLDMFQRHIFEEYFLLFPFSWKTLEFGLLWPESWFYVLPFLIGAVALNEMRRHLLDSNSQAKIWPEAR